MHFIPIENAGWFVVLIAGCKWHLCNYLNCFSLFHRQSTKSVALKKVTERKRCKVDSECVNVKSESSVSDDDTSDKGDSDDEVTFDLPASVVDEIKCDSKSVSFESGCDVKNSFKKKNESENSQTVMVNKTGYLEDDADSDNNDNSGTFFVHLFLFYNIYHNLCMVMSVLLFMLTAVCSCIVALQSQDHIHYWDAQIKKPSISIVVLIMKLKIEMSFCSLENITS